MTVRSNNHINLSRFISDNFLNCELTHAVIQSHSCCFCVSAFCINRSKTIILSELIWWFSAKALVYARCHSQQRLLSIVKSVLEITINRFEKVYLMLLLIFRTLQILRELRRVKTWWFFFLFMLVGAKRFFYFLFKKKWLEGQEQALKLRNYFHSVDFSL